MAGDGVDLANAAGFRTRQAVLPAGACVRVHSKATTPVVAAVLLFPGVGAEGAVQVDRVTCQERDSRRHGRGTDERRLVLGGQAGPCGRYGPTGAPDFAAAPRYHAGMTVASAEARAGIRADFDTPWKEALERYFREFLALFFPAAHDGIDWARGHEFLDKELEKVVRDAELGRRLLDKLAHVWRQDGEEELVLVHVEVQGQKDDDFAQRMYVYNYRLFDR
ncbi:MAG: hypothetical protein HY814_02290 [Candidatus Riflebacteria bacterium]|nr:hypothetical protein [Candidatus Riflebacteria bacterium]